MKQLKIRKLYRGNLNQNFESFKITSHRKIVKQEKFSANYEPYG